MRNKFLAVLPILASSLAWGQSQPDLRQILDRLQRLEDQNRELLAEVHSLKEEIVASRSKPADAQAAEPALAERMEVQERRTEDLAQTRVESEHRFPVQLTGMVLFNTYWNGAHSGNQSFPVVASPVEGQSLGGGTLRQSILGLKFQGPSIFWGGKVSGSMYMDFFGGSGTSLDQLMRIRIATLDLDWKRTTVSFGQDKPIIAPREPNSLAQVGVSPLTAAGNLWLWQPQIRVEQRFTLGDSAGLRAQLGVFQTNESTAGLPPDYANALSRARPGLQGRFEFWKDFGNGRRIELAPGFHVSNSRIEDQSLPSRVYAFDWLIRPVAAIDFTGTIFTGENTAVLGGLRPGITYFPNGDLQSVGGSGGWAQLTIRAGRKTSFNFYGGQQSNHTGDLLAGSISRNRAYAGNIMYKLGSNVVASFEAYQARTTYLGVGDRLVPHYDLALAYLY